ncbi:MAG: hypothetical protein JWM32_2543 [Verrucomicrobia bacterium]|nr:hypothetical protein [Verrucomicrobiota bacterium]
MKHVTARGNEPAKNHWKNVLTLDRERRLVSGTAEALVAAIRRGADLRVYTEFRHNEHIDTTSTDAQLIKEAADFRVTYLLEDRWVAGIINLRQPIELPIGFGPRPSMSFFLYNQDGKQAIARPYLDGQPATGGPGPSPLDDHSQMPKYHQSDAWDQRTNAPSSNFAYDFEVYKYWVCDDWQEVLAHTAEGKVDSGSVGALEEAFAGGREVKVGIVGLCADLAGASAEVVSHEVFVHCGSCYYYTESKLFMAAAQPVVRVQPAIPLRYRSEGWDFGWLMPRTDGHVARWLLDPYTLKFSRSNQRHAIRWFVR